MNFHSNEGSMWRDAHAAVGRLNRNQLQAAGL